MVVQKKVYNIMNKERHLIMDSNSYTARSDSEIIFTWKVAINFLSGLMLAFLFMASSWILEIFFNKFHLQSNLACKVIIEITSWMGVIVLLVYFIVGICMIIKTGWKLLKWS